MTTQGKTLNLAKRNLQEAVALYLETWGDKESCSGEIYLTSIDVAA